MARAEVSTTIKRPVEEVFAVVSDASRDEQWISSVNETTKTSAGPIGVGTTWRSVGKFLGRRIEMDITYTEFEPNDRLTFDMTGPFAATMWFTFEAVADGTRVVQVVDGEPGGFFKLVGPLFTAVAKRQFQNDLDTLRDLMEGGALAG